ncbi:MAG TPA: transcription termination factor NusA [Candidatus Portnoybacteria bacterium]|jgi:transcription termination/antitermination protein NusA|nr:transcription termination factor NusA [Candidatus Portnoybacteria bacterium]MDD5752450.1 transcription termination factor NusA [Candidatus Portnoybacteria bacterium]HNU96903.1 transcription termination factor NusA [Candidatus Portnoybacteria bacterium]HOZ16658.1 transcription termination factor NusA [Candidatus Portnoybacteria bacterium]HPH52359.1 transcription termination factor NusA [Candidatus Portnoybacteria bacterium]
MDQKQFLSAMSQIAEEKGIAQEQIVETLEMAIAAAYKKDYGKKGQNIKVKFDIKTGEIKVFQVFLVVDENMLKKDEQGNIEEEIPALIENETSPQIVLGGDVGQEEIEEGGDKKIRFNPYKHLMVEEAQKIKKGANVGDEIQIKLETHTNFGRIAAQTAKQVIIQRLREAEREVMFEEYKDKEGEVVSAIVQRIEGRNIFMDIGKASGILYAEEQIPGERFFIGQRLRVYILKVEKSSKGADIILSRAYPKLVSKLFSIEVPEISMGTVQIKSIAREPGSRTKIAVFTEEEGVDPVGSCVGQKGSRVQTVITELGGEKIDIIEWSENMEKYVSNALSPAKIISVKIDEKNRGALVLVPEDQISLAIGQRGQNVRLAAKLTGWKIDVKSEKMLEDEKKILNENQEENTEEIKKSKKSTTTPQEAPISEEEQTDLSQSENLSEENNDKKN